MKTVSELALPPVQEKFHTVISEIELDPLLGKYDPISGGVVGMTAMVVRASSRIL